LAIYNHKYTQIVTTNTHKKEFAFICENLWTTNIYHRRAQALHCDVLSAVGVSVAEAQPQPQNLTTDYTDLHRFFILRNKDIRK